MHAVSHPFSIHAKKKSQKEVKLMAEATKAGQGRGNANPMNQTAINASSEGNAGNASSSSSSSTTT